LQLDRFADRTPQQIGDFADQLVGIDRLRRQRLLPRKRQQPLREFGGAPHPFQRQLARAGDPLRCRRRRQSRDLIADDIEAAHHHRQQIVEIMRQTAGQLTDHLHLLGLA
jgi:hypothetical protein